MIKTISPKEIKNGVILYENIAYANRTSDFFRDNITLSLNLMLPYDRNCQYVRSPLLVWFEGGAWRNSSPNFRIPEFTWYVQHGFAVADVSYSVNANSIWPACIEDAKTAIRFLRENAEKYNLDSNNFFVGGESAGAHLAALIGLTNEDKLFKTKDYANQSDKVNGSICYYCPGDMTVRCNDYFNYNDLLIRDDSSKHPELVAELNPMTYVTNKNICPFLFFHGNKDSLVPMESSMNLYKKLEENNVDADYIIVDGVEHADLAFAQEEFHQMVLDFMNKNKK